MRSKFYDWKSRYGKANEHNATIPRDHWITDQERDSIIGFYHKNPLNGYRRLCYMMQDRGVVAVSPSTVRNVLRAAGLMDRRDLVASSKGKGFNQPSSPHKHWHTDISYINVGGTFYFLSSVLDGFSRYIVEWELKESIKEKDVEMLIQRALEKHPGAKPRIISDNGPQYISNDFKAFVKLTGVSHVKTSPYYPQSNGKIEAMHKSLKKETIRPAAPKTYKEAARLIDGFVTQYNNERLHSGLGYIAPVDALNGRTALIQAKRDETLRLARESRAVVREMIRATDNDLLVTKGVPASETSGYSHNNNPRFEFRFDSVVQSNQNSLPAYNLRI